MVIEEVLDLILTFLLPDLADESSSKRYQPYMQVMYIILIQGLLLFPRLRQGLYL